MPRQPHYMDRRTLLGTAAAGAAGWLAGGRAARAQESTADEPATDSITWSRRVPLRYEADVAVIGGGIAGVSAACAAARSGASVVLVSAPTSLSAPYGVELLPI